jgi:hypothetical protein
LKGVERDERRKVHCCFIITMVIVNDFKVQIVSAEDKVPFKEHKKGLKTYVEVEPDAEYILHVTSTRRLDRHCLQK